MLRRDGTPARGVRVVVGRDSNVTDDDGRVKFDAVPTGAQTVVASSHGYLPSFVRAAVGHDSDVVIGEAAPRRVRVVVTDAEGLAVPSARVTVTCEKALGPGGESYSESTTVAQIDGDTEILTPRTGADGSVTLDVPSGDVRFRVTLAGAAVSHTVHVLAADDPNDGGAVPDVRIVLPRP